MDTVQPPTPKIPLDEPLRITPSWILGMLLLLGLAVFVLAVGVACDLCVLGESRHPKPARA